MPSENKARILIVDDEEDVTDLLVYRLTQEGFEADAVNDPTRFAAKARDFKADLFILDVMMPEISGLQLCRTIRADGRLKHTPIILLTAKGEVEDRVKGLEHGADDYISKPFDMRELLLRIHRIVERTRREAEEQEESRIQIGNVSIDSSIHEVRVDGQPVTMTATEFRLLKLLMLRKGKVQTREHLLVKVWQYDAEIETRTVDTHVRRVRDKLGPYAEMIETIRGVGYRAIDLK